MLGTCHKCQRKRVKVFTTKANVRECVRCIIEYAPKFKTYHKPRPSGPRQRRKDGHLK